MKRKGTWRTIGGTWPDTIADMTHWLGDSRLGSQVEDQEVGHFTELQWHYGRAGKYTVGTFVLAAGGVLVGTVTDNGEPALVGRGCSGRWCGSCRLPRWKSARV